MLIPRHDMPQVAASDLTALIQWLTFNGVAVTECERRPDSLTFRQAVYHVNVNASGAPILISNDSCILDGNHRATLAKLEAPSVAVRCLMIGLPFAEAFKALFTFAGTYRSDRPERPTHTVADAEAMGDLGYI